jgi:hypothetical protein
VTEINGKDNNLNQDFETESVSSAVPQWHQFILLAYQFRSAWLVSHYTSAPSAACTDLDILIQTDVDGNYLDLSKGFGRERRYIVPVVSPSNNDKITEVRLLRSHSSTVRPPEGYSRISRNINQGRGGDYLYVVWKMVWFDPIPIPDGVYVIRSKATDTVVDLSAGNSGNEAVIWGWFAVPMEHHYFNQNWWIEKVGVGNRYTIRNVRTNTYMEVAGGRPENGTRVQGYQKNDTVSQEWHIIGTNESGYRYDTLTTSEKFSNPLASSMSLSEGH